IDSVIPHNSDTARKVPPLSSYQIVTANFYSKDNLCKDVSKLFIKGKSELNNHSNIDFVN
ncbi:8601_t:CDS:1, partial [Ambispora leptoticha]